MDLQIKISKSVTTLVFYVPEDRLEKAKEAVPDLKAILNKHGFVVDYVSESRTKGH